ncbi:exopolyphosphatase PRUNE1 isoform X2 [Rosa chinensis]|uniref:exopolyphosphatase PRUNE1 isoform X2 n=1 Tax=Rosa chinensis TaxID=74649 RepID=UPI001AD8E263|nr:exopolyphosphatase PRUNE1 isoform X2 [Rosa chinensis]
MRSPTSPRPKAVAQPQKETYSRARKNPFFNGLIDGPPPAFDFNVGHSRNIARSMSDIGHKQPQDTLLDVFERFSPNEKPFDRITPKEKSSSFSIKKNPFEFSPEKNFEWSENGKSESFEFTNVQTVFCSNLATEENDQQRESVSSNTSPTVEKTFRVNRRKENLSAVPLPQSAASFYNGNSPQFEISESCPSIKRLNRYLKATKDEVNAGVPGRFLHAVIAQDVPDVGSLASTIMYAFYVNETHKSDHLCTVPVINMKRSDISSQSELKWLLASCQIDHMSLIFVDEGDSVYPWVDTVTVGQDSSCCTPIAEKFALRSPEILAGHGFSRFLLAAILLDSANLSSSNCSIKDKYMAAMLIHGAGRFGCDGLYQLLRYKMYDVTGLKVADILRKDFKKWTQVGNQDNTGSRLTVSYVGMSSIGTSISELLDHEESPVHEIKYFQQVEKLRLLMIVSGYYDLKKNFKREILVSAQSVELMRNLLSFFNSSASQLPLKAIPKPGLGEQMQAFEIDKIISRKTIERLLEEFGGNSKG